MTDIVERLRGHPGEGQTVTQQFRNMVEQRHEAAAEIERLRTANEYAFNELTATRAEIERLRADGEALATKWTATHAKLLSEFDKLRAEIERLTWALEGATTMIDRRNHEIERLRALVKELGVLA